MLRFLEISGVGLRSFARFTDISGFLYSALCAVFRN